MTYSNIISAYQHASFKVICLCVIRKPLKTYYDKVKSKVDNLYRGSIVDPIAAEPLLQYFPSSLDPCHWLPNTGALTWKPSQGTNLLYCLVNRGTLVFANNLPKVVARQCRSRELNPQPPDHEFDTLASTPPNYRLISWVSVHLRFDHTSIL